MAMLFPMSQEFRLTFLESLVHTLISLIVNTNLEVEI